MLKLFKRLALLGLIFTFGIILFSYLSYHWVARVASSKIYTSIENIPYNDVGLVLGTIKTLGSGRENPFFTYRIDAAVALYQNGKIKHILVSGDNSRKSYNEPEDMQQALIEKGIPPSAITLDYAGFRTFDSVIRAREVFQLEKITVISQQFHNERAVFIANKLNLEVVGYNAREVMPGVKNRAEVREYLARIKAILDLYILRTKPKYLGEKITINIE